MFVRNIFYFICTFYCYCRVHCGQSINRQEWDAKSFLVHMIFHCYMKRDHRDVFNQTLSFGWVFRVLLEALARGFKLFSAWLKWFNAMVCTRQSFRALLTCLTWSREEVWYRLIPKFRANFTNLLRFQPYYCTIETLQKFQSNIFVVRNWTVGLA